MREHLREGPVKIARVAAAQDGRRDSLLAHARRLQGDFECEVEAAVLLILCIREIRQRCWIGLVARIKRHREMERAPPSSPPTARARWQSFSPETARAAGTPTLAHRGPTSHSAGRCRKYVRPPWRWESAPRAGFQRPRRSQLPVRSRGLLLARTSDRRRRRAFDREDDGPRLHWRPGMRLGRDTRWECICNSAAKDCRGGTICRRWSREKSTHRNRCSHRRQRAEASRRQTAAMRWRDMASRSEGEASARSSENSRRRNARRGPAPAAISSLRESDSQALAAATTAASSLSRPAAYDARQVENAVADRHTDFAAQWSRVAEKLQRANSVWGNPSRRRSPIRPSFARRDRESRPELVS